MSTDAGPAPASPLSSLSLSDPPASPADIDAPADALPPAVAQNAAAGASVGRNPFPGLRPFEAAESHLFFGRNGQAVAIIDKLEDTRFVAVVGTSGSGKSSLVRAGLLPQLEGGLMAEAGACWRIAIMKPGESPLRHLAHELARPTVLGEGAPDEAVRAIQIETMLRRGSLGLTQVMEQARLEPEDNLLVVVDQFEELFRMAELRADGAAGAADEAAAFVAMLLQAARQTAQPIYVVLTMRSDFLGDCAQFRDLPEALNRGQYLVPRMTRDELRSAIEGPVAVGGATITPRLVQELLNEVGDDPDQLPVLQHALMRTWDTWLAEKQPHEPLDLTQFRRVGALKTALSNHADEVLRPLSDSCKVVACRVFQRLCERGTDARETRRASRLSDLYAVAGPGTEADVRAVIEAFRAPGRTFLMPPPSVPLEPDTVVDISHEALIRQWVLLRAWVEAEAQSGALYRRLAEAAERSDSLWRGRQLSAALEWKRTQAPTEAWARRYHLGFAAAMAFLEDSRKADQRSQMWRGSVFVLMPLLLIISAVIWKIWTSNVALTEVNAALTVKGREIEQQKNELEQQKSVLEVQRDQLEVQTQQLQEYAKQLEKLEEKARGKATQAQAESVRAQGLGREATASKLAAQSLLESDGETSSLLAVEALGVSQTDETVAAMWKAMVRPTALPSLRHPGRRLLSISADGLRAVSVGSERDLMYWDLARGIRLAQIKLPQAREVSAVAISAHGDRIFVAGDAPFLSLYEWREEALRPLPLPPGQPHTKQVRYLRLSADGRTLASGGGNVLALWDVAPELRLRHTLVQGGADVAGLDFDEGGRWLAAVLSSEPRQVKVWDTASGRELMTRSFPTTPRLQFAKDALVMLASAPSGDGALKVRTGPAFDADLPDTGQRNAGQRGFVVGPKGRNIYTDSGDGALTVWSVDGGMLYGRSFSGVARLASMRLALPETSQVDVITDTGDNRRMAFALQDNSSTGMAGLIARYLGTSKSPPYLVVTSEAATGSSRVFNLPRQRTRTFQGIDFAWPRVQQLAFTGDGRQLLVATGDEILRYDLMDGGVRRPETPPPLGDEVVGLAVGTHGLLALDRRNTLLGQTDAGGSVQLRDEWGNGSARPRPEGGAVAPDGSGMVMAPVRRSDDGTTSVVGLSWVETNGRRVDLPVPPLEAAGDATGVVEGVAASAGGRRVAWALEGSDERAPQVQVWDTGRGVLVHELDGAGSVLTMALSRDGQRLAAVVREIRDGTAVAPRPDRCPKPGRVWLQTWDLRTDGVAHAGPCWPLGNDVEDVYRLEFTAGGQTLLVFNRTDADLRWQAWPLGEPGAAAPAGGVPPFKASSYALSADEKRLAAFDRTRGLVLFDLATPLKPPRKLLVGDTLVTALAFTPDGRLLMGGADDGSIYVWNVDDGTPRARLRFGHRRPVSSFAFDPTGNVLVSGDRGGSLATWSVPALRGLPGVMQSLCAQVGRNMNIESWRAYMREAPYRSTCSNVPSGDGVVESLFSDAWSRADAGDAAGARRLVASALAMTGSGPIEVGAALNACRRAALAGAGAEALPMCDRAAAAVAAAGSDYPTPLTREGRAIALALRGRYAEAAADLRAVIEAGKQPAAQRAIYEGWVRQLESRRNPFSPAQLSALRAGR